MKLGWSNIGVPSKFDSKICNSIDSQEQKIFEKFDENQFELYSFKSTPTIGWSQIFRNWTRSKFIRRNLKVNQGLIRT